MVSNIFIDKHIALWAFDFDGNILAPDTVTYVIDKKTGEEVGIAAHKLDQNPELIHGENAQYMWKEDIIDSLSNFRDFHSSKTHLWPNQLKHDIEEALERKAFSPSLESLKTVFLIPARFFAIITSRWHGPDNLARIMWILNESLLTDEEKEIQYKNIHALHEYIHPNEKLSTRIQTLRFYFEEIVSYYPVSNPHIAKCLGMSYEQSMAKRKTIAMKHYLDDMQTRIIEKIWLENTPLAIGFSDDSVSNMEAMIDFFKEKRVNGLNEENTVHLYFTGKKWSLKTWNLVKNRTEKEDMTIIEL